MWTEAQIREALFFWRVALQVEESDKSEDSPYHRGLAAGYVGALEMVLGDHGE